jgi:uncharacterized protein YjdB
MKVVAAASRKVFSSATLAILFAIGVLSCTETVAPTPPATLALLPGLDSLEVGAEFNGFTVSAKDANGVSLKSFTTTWSSSNVDVATVSSSGIVAGLSQGTTNITATVLGKSASSSIHVIPRVASLLVTPDDVDMPLGSTRTLVASAFDAQGTAISGRKVTWSSSNPGIVAVNSNGVLTPVSVGTTSVLATVSTKQVTVPVVVRAEPVAQVRFTTPSTSSYVLRLGQTLQTAVQTLNSNGQPLVGRLVSYNSSNSSVASVTSAGLITANTVGQASVQAESEGRTTTVQIQVTLVPVSSVVVSPSPITMLEFETQQAVVTPKDSASNTLTVVGRNVQWTSSNSQVVTLSSASGNTVSVNGQNKGTATITAFVDGVPSAAVTVTINPQPVVSVDITGPSSVKVGSTITLQATPRDASGHALVGRQVSWSSSDNGKATVTINGQVQGKGAGPVIITATVEGVLGTASITVFP